MKRLNSEHIKLLHSILLEETGGLNGARDENMFESAVNSPFQTFDGIYVYSTLERKAARRGFSLIKNHPFIDGNKRIGVMTVLAFLELNGIVIGEHSNGFFDFSDFNVEVVQFAFGNEEPRAYYAITFHLSPCSVREDIVMADMQWRTAEVGQYIITPADITGEYDDCIGELTESGPVRLWYSSDA